MAIKYSVIIPAFNEENTIGRAVRETAAVFNPFKEEYEIVVVDDGSSDATVGTAEALTIEFPFLKIIKHEINRGKGEAVRTGVREALGEQLLFLDSDLATHPREVAAFIEKMGDYDIAIGSRRARGAIIAKPQPWFRIFYGRMINFFIRHFLKLPHNDTQCGFKMFRAEVAKNIFNELGPSRWVFDIEVLLRARANGYKIAELPVTWTNGEFSRVKTNEVLADLWYLVKLKNKLNR